jgi:hypothetical protein
VQREGSLSSSNASDLRENRGLVFKGGEKRRGIRRGHGVERFCYDPRHERAL